MLKEEEEENKNQNIQLIKKQEENSIFEKPKSLLETKSLKNDSTSITNNILLGSNIPAQNTQPKAFEAPIKQEEKQLPQIQEHKMNNSINIQPINQNIQIPKKPEIEIPIAKQEHAKSSIDFANNANNNIASLNSEKLEKEENEKNKPKLSAIEKLRLLSDNYFNLRSKINKISEDKTKKAISDKITTEINVTINQLSQMDDISNNATRISALLSELKKQSQLELYLFTIDFLFKRLIYKSEKYKSEHKRNYLIFGKFVFELNKLVGSNVVCDFFMQMIVYKCPYIAFKVINKADFPDDKTYKKRLGFTNESESMTDFFSNIESYSYLFFAFLFHSLRFYSSNPNHPNYKHYLSNLLMYLEDFINFFESCESKEIKYPHVVIYKVFLNCLGNETLKHVPNFTEKLIKIAMKIVKHMEEQKKKPGVTAEIKSLITDNLHFIKTYVKEIKERKLTDMHR